MQLLYSIWIREGMCEDLKEWMGEESLWEFVSDVMVMREYFFFFKM